MNKVTGFTLIELMIVLVILSILLLVALPAYQSSVIKSNRSAGRGILQDVVARQEQYFINNKTYADTLEKLGYGVDGADAFYVNKLVDRYPSATGDAVYQIGVNLISTLNYEVTALPKGLQLKDDRCQGFRITENGVKTNVDASDTAAPGSLDECW
ncbi:MAG: type IV pilin protein [Halioglobus sp.]